MSDLTLWDPLREMMSLRSMMERMFDNSVLSPRFDGNEALNWGLALDVAETGDAFVVKASLPGMNPDDLDVTYNNNVLTIHGEVKEEHESDERRYHLRERRYGSFSRSISLPSTINADAIDASYQDGVLTLTLPKVEEAKPRRITVQGSQNSPKMIEGKAKDVKSKK
jgi:HSP20 family protein